jgi:hypothetical protein
MAVQILLRIPLFPEDESPSVVYIGEQGANLTTRLNPGRPDHWKERGDHLTSIDFRHGEHNGAYDHGGSLLSMVKPEIVKAIRMPRMKLNLVSINCLFN